MRSSRRAGVGCARGRGSRRAVVLYAALVVIALGALVGTTVVYFADAERTAAEASLRRTQTRAMAWSGVQAVMAELAAQRQDLLRGGWPSVTSWWSAPAGEQEGERTWVFRLRLFPADGQPVQAEAGKLCINTATATMLEAVGVPGAVAARIVSQRSSRPFGSAAEIAGLEGASRSLLSQPPSPSTSAPGAAVTVSAGTSSAGSPGEVASAAPALIELLTVFAFDADVQVGYGDHASEVAGNLRINLNVPWSDRLGEAIEARWDKDVAGAIKGMMERGDRFDSLGAIVRKMRSLRLPVDSWAEVLDAFTASADPYRIGLVDLNSAPVQVLAAIPGISPQAAQEIVDRRRLLDDTARRTIAWPVSEGIVSQQDFEQAVDHLTMRSFQWRVVVESGRTRGDSASSFSSGFDRSADSPPSGDSAPLEDMVVLEAVIDVSSERPRVAYLRDITHLDIAEELANPAAPSKEDQPPPEEPTEASGVTDEPRPADTPADTDLHRHELDFDGPPTPSEPPLPEPAAADSAASPPTRAPVEGKDRRIGRWSSGQGGL